MTSPQACLGIELFCHGLRHLGIGCPNRLRKRDYSRRTPSDCPTPCAQLCSELTWCPASTISDAFETCTSLNFAPRSVPLISTTLQPSSSLEHPLLLLCREYTQSVGKTLVKVNVENSPEQVRPNCSRVCYFGHSSILCRYHHMSNTWPPRTIPAVCSFASCLTMRRISFCRLLPALQSFLTRPDFPQKHCTRSFFEFLSFTQRANVHRHCSASAAACALRISSTSCF